MKTSSLIGPLGFALILGAFDVLGGCGGATETPILGTASSPRVRALNIVPNSPSLTVTYDAFSTPLGVIGTDAQTAYSTQNEGSNTVSFSTSAGAVTSYSGVFQYSDYYTVVVYSGEGGYATFALPDNSSPVNSGLSQVRVANAVYSNPQNVDVYVTAGSSIAPTLVSSNLISVNGLAFATATGYKTESPGVYTVTVTPQNTPSMVLLNQTYHLDAGQAITVYTLPSLAAVTTNDDQ